MSLPVYGSFSYRAAETLAPLLAPGVRVLVPFGKRRATGYVLGRGEPPEGVEVKAIADVLDERPLFPAAMIPFFRWTADYYKHPLGEVIETALPGGLTVSESAVLTLTAEGRRRLAGEPARPAERRILNLLAEGPLRVRDLRRRLNREVPLARLANLESRLWIEREVQLTGGRTKARQERWVRLKPCDPTAAAVPAKKALILGILDAAGELPFRQLAVDVPGAAAHVRALERMGCVEVFYKRVYRDPFGDPIAPDSAPPLNPEQQAVVAAVCRDLGKRFRVFLLNGVTGSGKTEVYLRAAAEALAKGFGVLVLVPEIALIMQNERRFRARFGERIALLHSGLSPGERYDQWGRILQQKAEIVIGARSAIFAPLQRIGLVIVDEEHDSSYKQEGGLCYNARDLAVVRARESNCPVLLGSATPSLQSYYHVRSGKYAELRLTARVEQRPLPEIQVVDLRRCRDLRGPGRFISAELHGALADTLGRGEQALLFLNRRGFASFPVCAACGSALRCKHCDISLTLHRAAEAYRCHYCGFTRPAGTTCGSCGSAKIIHLGLGTEKLEAAVAALFPAARMARMDRDTTWRKGAAHDILKRLRNREIDILVGTQMVAKGHDFPDITLVGIICADLSLSFPDFRAGERTFQLLAQVAGRAGRGSRPGKVILQAYNPEHFSILAARAQDFESFYAQEIEFRKALAYPPVSRMVQLRISGNDPQKTRLLTERLGRHCERLKASEPAFGSAVDIMGPLESAIPRIADNFRWQILLKSLQAGPLLRFIDRLRADCPAELSARATRVVIDVDPYFLM